MNCWFDGIEGDIIAPDVLGDVETKGEWDGSPPAACVKQSKTEQHANLLDLLKQMHNECHLCFKS